MRGLYFLNNHKINLLLMHIVVQKALPLSPLIYLPNVYYRHLMVDPIPPKVSIMSVYLKNKKVLVKRDLLL